MGRMGEGWRRGRREPSPTVAPKSCQTDEHGFGLLCHSTVGIAEEVGKRCHRGGMAPGDGGLGNSLNTKGQLVSACQTARRGMLLSLPMPGTIQIQESLLHPSQTPTDGILPGMIPQFPRVGFRGLSALRSDSPACR